MGSLAPNAFEITDALKEWATKSNIEVHLERETQKFLDYHAAKGSRFKDWVRAWQKWVRQADEWARERKRPAPISEPIDFHVATGAPPMKYERIGERVVLPGE